MEQLVTQLFYTSLGRGGGIFFTVASSIVTQSLCFTATTASAWIAFVFLRDQKPLDSFLLYLDED